MEKNTCESFEWHGYRFEWDSYDMPHGSCEHYEGWRVTRHGKSYGLLDADVGKAKSELLTKLRHEAMALRKQLHEKARCTQLMATELGQVMDPTETFRFTGTMPPTGD